MRSIKNIKRVPIDRMVVGNWYYIKLTDSFLSLIKFTGINEDCIGKSKACIICDNYHYYGSYDIKYLCKVTEVECVDMASRKDVLKYYPDEQI